MKLYDDLGVERDATADEIKKAHRKAVKANHPDTGGDADKFLAVQKAFDTLGDEEKRRRYDETGDADGSSKMASDAKLRELLHHLVSGMIDGEIDLDTTDVVAHVKKSLAKVEAEIRKRIAQGEKKVARVDKMAKRLRKKAKKGKAAAGPLADMLFRSLDQKREELSKPLQESREALERHLVITSIFEAFDYDFETPEPRPWDRYADPARLSGTFIYDPITDRPAT